MSVRTTVVLIDDHPVVTAALREMLSGQPDFAVVGVAEDGPEGLELCERMRPELVLLDMILPGMSGLQVLLELRKKHPDMLILAVSGMLSRELIHLALSAGADAFISKSTLPGEMLERIRAFRDHRGEAGREETEALHWAMAQPNGCRSISLLDLEVLRLFVADMPVEKIARRLNRSASAIYRRLHRLKTSLQARNGLELQIAARRLGLDVGPRQTA